MSRPYLSLYVLLYVARMCVCSSRAAAVAAVMADAKIERRRKIAAGRKGARKFAGGRIALKFSECATNN